MVNKNITRNCRKEKKFGFVYVAANIVKDVYIRLGAHDRHGKQNEKRYNIHHYCIFPILQNMEGK